MLLLGGYAALATAATIALALRAPMVQRPSTPKETRAIAPDEGLGHPGVLPGASGATSGSTGSGSQPAPAHRPAVVPTQSLAEPPTWQVRLLPRDPQALSSALRAGGGSIAPLQRGNDPSVLVVRIDAPLLAAEENWVTLELSDTESRVLARERVSSADIHGGGTVVLTMGGSDLPAGVYVLRLRTSGDDDTIVDYPFRLPPLE